MATQSENWQDIERRAGYAAARKLQVALRASIGQSFRRKSGAIEKTSVSPRYRLGLLDRLVITSPHYSFQQHYGYHWPAEPVKASVRKPTTVRGYIRTGGSFVTHREVAGHARRGGPVRAYVRNIENKPVEHFSKAINDSNVLDSLADSLAESRAVQVIAKIQL